MKSIATGRRWSGRGRRTGGSTSREGNGRSSYWSRTPLRECAPAAGRPGGSSESSTSDTRKPATYARGPSGADGFRDRHRLAISVRGPGPYGFSPSAICFRTGTSKSRPVAERSRARARGLRSEGPRCRGPGSFGWPAAYRRPAVKIVSRFSRLWRRSRSRAMGSSIRSIALPKKLVGSSVSRPTFSVKASCPAAL